MARNGRRLCGGVAAATALFWLAGGSGGRLSLSALLRVSRPATAALHRLTAGIPFPAAEALAVVLAPAALLALARAAIAALSGRGRGPLGRWLKGALWTALALSAALALLWGPALALPVARPPEPDAGQLVRLCGELIGALNRSPLAFPEAAEALAQAPEAAGAPGCVVKAARYPEWMRVARISGLFVPLTGEALADAGAPAPLIPFTAVHELMHLKGIADEGAANIAAWQLCQARGGAFADSARLWALRYALGMLERSDPDARRRVEAKMKGALARAFREIHGDISPAGPASPVLSLARGDYAALVGWLAAGGAGLTS